MKFDFDEIIQRNGTGCVKFDTRLKYFGREDVTPLWVADMDFAAPDCITSALQSRLDHPVFGYSIYPDALYKVTAQWLARRHRWEVSEDRILMAPGIVPSLCAAIQAFTNEGDGVIVQPPVYFPFFSAITANHRELINNTLLRTDKGYEIDFAHLESCAKNGARLLVLCSPHNPVGRVWSESELLTVLEIARRYDLTIFSDDIHCDLIYPENTHTMLGRLAQPGDKIITAIAPNKTFNIPGLGLSALVVSNQKQRRAITAAFERLHVSNSNPFSIAAYEAAYRDGAEWLDALLHYLQTTRDHALTFFDEHIPEIIVAKPEATYLLWLDCGALGFNDSALKDFFIHDCKLGLSPGTLFGPGGEGFMRMNIGAPRPVVMDALEKLRSGIAQRRRG